MKSLKVTKTARNLLKSYARESQSVNRNTHYAAIAKREGYNEMEKLFAELANNEKECAKKILEFLSNSDLNEEAVIISDAGYPVFLRDSKGKLLATSNDENETLTTLYSLISENEKEKSGDFLNNESTLWRCSNCDSIFESDSEPEACSICENPKASFEIYKQYY